MANKPPATIAEYIEGAPPAGQPHLRQLHAILNSAAPQAEETIKWGTPFFVEPRFLFSFSAHKAHLGFTPSLEGLEPFRKELEEYVITKAGILKVRYQEPLPEDVIRRIAKHRVQIVSERADDSFW